MKLILAFLTAGLLIFSQSALAQSDDRINSWGNPWSGSVVPWNRDEVRFTDRDKAAIKQYYREFFRNYCERSGNSNSRDCRMSSAEKPYEIGRRLPRNVYATYLPAGLERTLSGPPRGYDYLRVDSDILLVESHSARVMDAFEIWAKKAARLYPIKRTYAVLFEPGDSTLRPGEGRILDQAAREAARMKARQVTVTSYADSRAGDHRRDDYRRNDVILDMLEGFGIRAGRDWRGSLENLARAEEHVVAQELRRHNLESMLLDSQDRGEIERGILDQLGGRIDNSQIVLIDLRW